MDPRQPPLAARPRRGLGSIPLLLIGVATAVTGAVLALRLAPCGDFFVGTEFSGSNRRLGAWIGSCPADLGAARSSLAADGLFIVGYVLTLAGILRRWWPLYQAPRLKQRERLVVALPFVVGALDVVENIATLIALGVARTGGGQRFTFPDNPWLPTFVSTTAWLKWAGAGVAVVLAVMAIGVAIASRHEPDAPRVSREPEPVPVMTGPPSGLGVCCSGGGIRATAYAIGALDELERGGVMRRARWLTAVSGGNYAATAWTLARTEDPSQRAADDVIRWLTAPIPGSTSGRHRFLRNGPGGLGRSVIAAASYIALNLVVLGSLVAVLSWPIGRVIGSRAVQPVFRTFHRVPRQLDVPPELWWPGLALGGVAAVVLLISALPSWSTSWLWRVAAGLAIAAAALTAVLVGIPAATVAVGNFLHPAERTGRPVAVGLLSLTGALGVVWRLARKPLTGQLARRLPQLGGVLLALAALMWGGKVATDAATAAGLFGSAERWAAAGVLFVVIYGLVGATQPSIHRIYRRRLLRTFGLRRAGDGRLDSPGVRGQVTWDELPAGEPELVVCCAQQRNGIAPGGLPADTFTISRREVRIGEFVTPTDRYLARLPKDLAGERDVAAWAATSGAAFASAMGRLSKGSTNALLAALNIDLGIWLPNPRLTDDPAVRFPKVRFGYLFKEILGWYDAADRYVFVADGGHWENLGLVELLRRRCAVIVCIDASGDDAGGFGTDAARRAFGTLRQAVELASLELPGIVAAIDLSGLERLVGNGSVLPPTTVTTLSVDYVGGFSGTIVYAKAQLAADLDIGLRRYAKADRGFPNYSTANQFLSNDQFAQLVDLGRASGRRVVDSLDGLQP